MYFCAVVVKRPKIAKFERGLRNILRPDQYCAFPQLICHAHCRMKAHQGTSGRMKYQRNTARLCLYVPPTTVAAPPRRDLDQGNVQRLQIFHDPTTRSRKR